MAPPEEPPEDSREVTVTINLQIEKQPEVKVVLVGDLQVRAAKKVILLPFIKMIQYTGIKKVIAEKEKDITKSECSMIIEVAAPKKNHLITSITTLNI